MSRISRRSKSSFFGYRAKAFEEVLVDGAAGLLSLKDYDRQGNVYLYVLRYCDRPIAAAFYHTYSI